MTPRKELRPTGAGRATPKEIAAGIEAAKSSIAAAPTDADAALLRYLIVGLTGIVATSSDPHEARSLAVYALALAERLDALAGAEVAP